VLERCLDAGTHGRRRDRLHFFLRDLAVAARGLDRAQLLEHELEVAAGAISRKPAIASASAKRSPKPTSSSAPLHQPAIADKSSSAAAPYVFFPASQFQIAFIRPFLVIPAVLPDAHSRRLLPFVKLHAGYKPLRDVPALFHSSRTYFVTP
jgi:hypothetical protein